MRAWLFGDPAQQRGSLAAAIRSVGAEVEDAYGIEVEVITVGDLRPSDARDAKRWSALAGATREALVNAAKHSGERSVDVYCEVTDEQVEVYVRDRGKGFDPELVDEDRQGIDKSIRARMERVGGRSRITSTPGRGTNVALTMPRGDGVPVEESSAYETPAEGARAADVPAGTGEDGPGTAEQSQADRQPADNRKVR